MRIGRIAHLLDGAGEQLLAQEDAGVLGKEAKDEAGHELVEIVPPRLALPIRIFLQQLQIEPVEAARGLNINRVVANLPNGGDASERQEKAKMIGKLGVGASNCLAQSQVFRLQKLAIGRQNELRLGRRGFGTGLQSRQRGGDGPLIARRNMNVGALQNPFRHIGGVGGSYTKFLERGGLVPECFQEGIGELLPLEGPLGKVGDSLFDFDGVHARNARLLVSEAGLRRLTPPMAETLAAR